MIEIRNEKTVHEGLARELILALKEAPSSSGSPLLALSLLQDAVRERATDVHIEARNGKVAAIRFRIDGALLDVAVLPRTTVDPLENQLKVLAQLDPSPATRPAKARWTAEIDDREIDVRLTLVPVLIGERLNLRLFDPKLFDSATDNLSVDSQRIDPLMRCLRQREGMLLVSGPTGSGKTTTVYALMERLAEQPRSVVAVEDPPEFQMPGISQVAVDDEHGLSFPEAIRAALRMDPDYLLVGELRDEASMQAAVEAATTGCVVFGTVHARDAVGTVTSLRKWNCHDYELSTLLSVVVAQRLVRKLCDHCRRQDEPDDSERSWFELVGMETPVKVWRATGCPLCYEQGYRGRIPIFETWTIDEADRKRLLDGMDERELRRHLSKRGHTFLLADAMKKIADGETDITEIRTIGGGGPGMQALESARSVIV